MRICGSLTSLAVVGWTSALSAHPAAHFALSWDAPPGCPTAEDVRARVDALLDGGASAGSVGDVRAAGQVERSDSGFRLLLSMSVGSTPSTRVINAHTCEELAGAAAIAIALLARSTSNGVSPPSTGDGPPTATPGGEQQTPAAAPALSQSQNSQKVATVKKDAPAEPPPVGGPRLVIDAPIGVAAWGLLPSAGLGLGAGLGIRWKALRVTASAQWWNPEVFSVSGFATRFTLLSGGAEACLTQAVRGLELGPCVGAGLQRLAGEGVGSEAFSATTRTAVWVSGTAGLLMSLPTPGFAHLRFFGEARVLVSPRRPRFVIGQLGRVHEPALAAPQLDLGCEWIF